MAFVFDVSILRFVDGADHLLNRIKVCRQSGIDEMLIVPLPPTSEPSQHDRLSP